MKYGVGAVLAAALLASVPALAQSQGAAGQTGGTQAQNTGQQPPQSSAPSQGGGQQQAQNGGGQTQMQAVSPRFTRLIQLRLHRAGVLDEEPTGVWDSDTAEAVGNFQQQHNLEPTGQLDGLTILALMARPAPGSAASSDGTTAQSGSSSPDQQPQQAAPQAQSGQGLSGGPSTATGGPSVNVAAEAYVAGYTRGIEQGFRQAQALMLHQSQAQRRMPQSMDDE